VIEGAHEQEASLRAFPSWEERWGKGSTTNGVVIGASILKEVFERWNRFS